MSSTRECKTELGYTRSSSKSSKTFLESLHQGSVSDELRIFIDKLEENRKNAIYVLTRQKSYINLETKKQCSKNHTLTVPKFSTHVHLPSIFKPWKPSFPKLKNKHAL